MHWTIAGPVPGLVGLSGGRAVAGAGRPGRLVRAARQRHGRVALAVVTRGVTGRAVTGGRVAEEPGEHRSGEPAEGAARAGPVEDRDLELVGCQGALVAAGGVAAEQLDRQPQRLLQRHAVAIALGERWLMVSAEPPMATKPCSSATDPSYVSR